MDVISGLEQATALDPAVSVLQRAARLIRPGRLRDALNGVWLGHPLHPTLVQAPVGAWLSATVLGLASGHDRAVRQLTALGVMTAIPAAITGAADWSEQHEQQLRVGIVHAVANWVAVGCYGASLACRSPRAAQALRLSGFGALSASGLLGAHLSFRLAGGVNHAEAVPHLVEPGWHYLMPESELAEGGQARRLLGEVAVVAVRQNGRIFVLADRCSHMSGPLSGGELAEGALTCPWHGSRFRLGDGAVLRGPGTAPQPVFECRTAGGAIQVMLPDAG